MSAPFFIVGYGACTALGYSQEATLAAMGAGVDAFATTSVPGTAERTRITGAHPHLAADGERADRLSWLLSRAIDDFRGWAERLADRPLPVVAALPRDLSAEERRALHALLASEPLFRPTSRWAIAFGRAAGFAALDAGRRLMEAGESALCAVVAVDSLCSSASVDALQGSGRLLGPGTEGTLPGEAAVVALLCAQRHRLATEPTAMQVERIALHRAAVPFTERAAADGDALAELFGKLRRQGTARVEGIVAAHSGEGAMGRSFSTAYLRETELMPEPLEVELIADKLGDLGAASCLIGCAYAAYLAGRDSSGRPARQLVYAESDSGELGAVVLAGRPAWRREPLRRASRTSA